MMVLHPELPEAQTRETIERAKRLVEGMGGEVHEMDEWGMRDLAYSIRKVNRGYYVVHDRCSVKHPTSGANGDRAARWREGRDGRSRPARRGPCQCRSGRPCRFGRQRNRGGGKAFRRNPFAGKRGERIVHIGNRGSSRR